LKPNFGISACFGIIETRKGVFHLMKSSLKIGSVLGIPIKLHITLLLVLPIFAYFFAINSQPFGFDGVEPPITRNALSTLAAILLFATILVHELAHSYMAKRYGVYIYSFTLFLFGGITDMKEVPLKPGQEEWMVFAGPLTSLVIGSICIFMYKSLIFLIPALSQNPTYLILLILGYENIVLGVFNLLPAFPMDGGRMLRSFYARRMSYEKATYRATTIGKFFAILMAIFGIYIENFWIPLVALFIYISASGEERSIQVK
jgi:Zn-dependent protease